MLSNIKTEYTTRIYDKLKLKLNIKNLTEYKVGVRMEM